MKRVLSFVLVAAAIAGPAAAQEVPLSFADRQIQISTEGKDPATIRADINRAAARLCWIGQKRGMLLVQEMSRCIKSVAADGMVQAFGGLPPIPIEPNTWFGPPR
jgi:hypothetical protein